MEITAERVREVISYNPDTGTFRWVKSGGRKRTDIDAGCICRNHGYRLIGIDGKLYRANRLAWLYMTGDWPVEYVDHIDGNRLNDRWANLRPATHVDNLGNSKKPVTNTSGFKGVYFHKQSKLWRARINKGKKTHSLGLYPTPELAGAAYARAAEELYGAFARTE